jgi:hypothetical protein
MHAAKERSRQERGSHICYWNELAVPASQVAAD